ncbi:helix-turn-helix domain-containing protein [Streptomyces seoulensis]|uniref:helix-turn-helix domain-containing protein n=1 Tax=Streptomyces seoulensis TaxID=73044 RepID=UPI001FCA961E|nr:helix-turn-helix transcriptional regulator [Streptomyces seoulensis]BDH07148.1 hypothetical protein HEK131_43750 [Streptomyces seoulensis]
MTTTKPAQLTPREQRIAPFLARGLRDTEIAPQIGIAPSTVRWHRTQIRRKLGCPTHSYNAILVHHLLAGGHAETPIIGTPAPALNKRELRLIRAVTRWSRHLAIARGARIPPGDYNVALGTLLAKTGAADITELVIRAHSWDLLGGASR